MLRKLGIVAGFFVAVFLLALLPVLHQASAQIPGFAWPNPPYPAVNVNCATTTCTLVAAPAAGSVCVYSMSITNAGATAITLNAYQDGGTNSVGSTFLTANGGNAFFPNVNNPKAPWFITNQTTAFVIKTSTAVQLQGSIYAQVCP